MTQVTPGKVNEVCEVNYIGHFIPKNRDAKSHKAIACTPT